MMRDPSFRAWRALLFVAVTAQPLAACVDQPVALNVADMSQAGLARRPDVSPHGAAVAFANIEGPPETISARFATALAEAAANQDVAIADAKTARYFVRGYLTAYPVEGGTAIAFVSDVFDLAKQRAQRLNDGLVVNGSAADPWSLADDYVLASLAAKSAGDLAAFLSNTPEAIAAAKAAGPAIVSAAPPPTARRTAGPTRQLPAAAGTLSLAPD